jgi:hypothetical protein
VWRERVLQSRRATHESRNIGDLVTKLGMQEIVLHQKDSILSNGQISGEGGFPAASFPQKKINFAEVLMFICAYSEGELHTTTGRTSASREMRPV